MEVDGSERLTEESLEIRVAFDLFSVPSFEALLVHQLSHYRVHFLSLTISSTRDKMIEMFSSVVEELEQSDSFIL